MVGNGAEDLDSRDTRVATLVERQPLYVMLLKVTNRVARLLDHLPIIRGPAL